ncbi:hypothetical protein [Stutzerimonas chloritidismutans]|uniref:hypothetical protein n=1 Tax=Stutzerimonas chloritidismutans TaxID=203192 RepID=UPI003F171C4C
MESRVIMTGIIIAAVSYAVSIRASELYSYATLTLFHDGTEFLAPLGGLLKNSINSIYWFIPGFFIGFTARSIKSAAMVGLIAGVLFFLIGMSIQGKQLHELEFVYAALSFYIARIVELIFLFTLAASFGVVVSEHRRVLTRRSSRSLRSLGTG